MPVLDGLEVDVAAALGAAWSPEVGKDADLTRLDPYGPQVVRILPAAVEAAVRAGWLEAAVRAEEGMVHAGGLELAEARVVASPAAWLHAWIGRADLPVTRDHDLEIEDLLLTVRPVVSRAVLPAHATGLGGAVGVPDRGRLRAGASYASLQADAPYLWTRLDAFPLGEVPDAEGSVVEGLRFRLGAGVSRLDSPSLGTATTWTGDLSVRLDSAGLDLAWVDCRCADGAITEATGQVGTRVFWLPGRPADVHLAARVERATGLEEHEDVRWIVAERLSFRSADGRAAIYVEAWQSREEGRLPASPDVVDLGRGIERRNDAIVIGALLRTEGG